MAWSCGECGASEGRDGETVIDAVCHHCGKLLCRQHQRWIEDLAFAAPRGGAAVQACHCSSCAPSFKGSELLQRFLRWVRG